MFFAHELEFESLSAKRKSGLRTREDRVPVCTVVKYVVHVHTLHVLFGARQAIHWIVYSDSSIA